MTKYEAINYLIRPTQTSTKPLPEYLKQQEAYQMAIEALSARKQGKWVNHRNDDGHNIADCNLCGNTLQWFDNDGEHNYCPNCGARMVSEE